MGEQGEVITDGADRTTAYGVYIAGEIEKGCPSLLVISAADGYKAATSIDMDLILERF
ncbi:hypothetical protein [Priestia koreensis]|uniref:hypothetical protein n=1 Tax=Priestia koreensis TaxID=284581 RepID=UPI0028F730E9|nr:hypothetical protein [Priestia koreensis]